jgi:hypothetical protein
MSQFIVVDQGFIPSDESESPVESCELDKCCLNCLTRHTSLWRKDQDGLPLCNACGLYWRNHGRPRPLGAIRLPKIKTKKSLSKKSREYSRDSIGSSFSATSSSPTSSQMSGSDYETYSATPLSFYSFPNLPPHPIWSDTELVNAALLLLSLKV